MPNVSRRSIIDTHPESTVSNSQMPGIGRLLSAADTLFINNLGRNIEISRPVNGILEPQGFSFITSFPDDDEKCQFDLDIHAFVVSPDHSGFWALNHYGYLRYFNLDYKQAGTHQQAELKAELIWPGDVERFQFFDNCFISTSPAGYAVDSPPESGILFSSPVNNNTFRESRGPEGSTRVLSYEKHLEDWGRTTAFRVSTNGKYLAVAANGHLGVFDLVRNANGITRPASPVWETALPYAVTYMKMFDYDRKILVAGVFREETEDNGFEWNHLTGGNWTVYSTDDGTKLRSGDLDAEIAWGNGGEALLLYDQSTLIGIDRRAGLYAWNINCNYPKKQLIAPQEAECSEPLGIAHITRHGNEIFCGFNRGGYRLWRYSFN